ncbi:hypothetical protein BB560_003410, partial [Smittium megazygosporum]
YSERVEEKISQLWEEHPNFENLNFEELSAAEQHDKPNNLEIEKESTFHQSTSQTVIDPKPRNIFENLQKNIWHARSEMAVVLDAVQLLINRTEEQKKSYLELDSSKYELPDADNLNIPKPPEKGLLVLDSFQPTKISDAELITQYELALGGRQMVMLFTILSHGYRLGDPEIARILLPKAIATDSGKESMLQNQNDSENQIDSTFYKFQLSELPSKYLSCELLGQKSNNLVKNIPFISYNDGSVDTINSSRNLNYINQMLLNARRSVFSRDLFNKLRSEALLFSKYSDFSLVKNSSFSTDNAELNFTDSLKNESLFIPISLGDYPLTLKFSLADNQVLNKPRSQGSSLDVKTNNTSGIKSELNKTQNVDKNATLLNQTSMTDSPMDVEVDIPIQNHTPDLDKVNAPNSEIVHGFSDITEQNDLMDVDTDAQSKIDSKNQSMDFDTSRETRIVPDLTIVLSSMLLSKQYSITKRKMFGMLSNAGEQNDILIPTLDSVECVFNISNIDSMLRRHVKLWKTLTGCKVIFKSSTVDFTLLDSSKQYSAEIVLGNQNNDSKLAGGLGINHTVGNNRTDSEKPSISGRNKAIVKCTIEAITSKKHTAKEINVPIDESNRTVDDNGFEKENMDNGQMRKRVKEQIGSVCNTFEFDFENASPKSLKGSLQTKTTALTENGCSYRFALLCEFVISCLVESISELTDVDKKGTQKKAKP